MTVTSPTAAGNNINAMIANILSELNTSIDLSRINPNIDFTLAGTSILSDDLHGVCRTVDSSLGNTIESMMRDRMIPFHTIDNDILASSADVALVIVTTENSIWYRRCGPFTNFRLGGVAVRIFESGQPIAMTTDTYALGDLTALHELGHVFRSK